MANFSQTVTNTLRLGGTSPPTLWGTAIWGTDLWNNTEDLQTTTIKSVANTLSLTGAIDKRSDKWVTGTISFASDVPTVEKSQGVWEFIFPSNTNDGADAVYDAFTRVSENSATQTATTKPSTTWTDA